MDGAQREKLDVPPDTGEMNEASDPLHHRYAELVLRAPAGMILANENGSILECNDALARSLGYRDREELLKQPASRLFRSAAEEEQLWNKLRDDGRYQEVIVLLHKKGMAVHMVADLVLERHEQGPWEFHGQMQRTFDEEGFGTLLPTIGGFLEHIRDGVLLITDGRVRYANAAAIGSLGKDPTGDVILDLFQREDGARVDAMLRECLAVGSAPPLTVRTNGDQLEISILATTAVVAGGTVVQFTLQDQSSVRDLLKERNRVQMVEEVNQVLRLEIAEHRRTQEQLRHSRRFAKSLVDSSLDMIIAADPEGRITEYNPAAATRFGWEPREVLGQRSIMLYADQVQFDRIQQELNEHGVFAGEIQNITKYGEVFTSFLAASRLYDEDGQLLGAMGVSRDITQMLRDQEALRLSEERYRDLFENATDLIQSVDGQGRFEYVNNAWRNALGYTDDDLDAMSCIDVIHPDHRETFSKVFEEVMSRGGVETISTVFIGKNGQRVYVEGTLNTRSREGRTIAMRTIFRDVTNMHLAREKVRAHEAKLRALFESSEHMFWTVEPGMRLTSFNRGYADMIERLHGMEPLLGTDPNRPRRLAATQEYLLFWEQRYAEAFAGKPLRFEIDVLDMQDERVCNEIFLSPVFDAQGKVAEVFGVGHEITEQKVAEDLVREQAARLKAIFDSSANMMIWTLDRDLRITSCNDHFLHTIEESHGIRFKIGDPFVDEMAARVAGGVYKPLLARYQATLKGKAQQFEVELIDREGNSIWVENFLNPIETEGEIREISCLAYGITDRKAAQIELLRSLNEKEVLLKEVHHRVKNNLQVISSILSLQTAHVGDDKRILDLLRDSRDRIRSMSFIHESLYQTKDFSSIDLANYIEGLSRNLMMSYSLSGKVALRTELQRVHLVLDQAIPCGLILNEIISNALKHAFPGGREGEVTIRSWTEGDQVNIKVSDNGVGVPAGFDVERDGNLGLELVRTLVDQLDGHLQISDGQGVAYLVTFERTK